MESEKSGTFVQKLRQFHASLPSEEQAMLGAILTAAQQGWGWGSEGSQLRADWSEEETHGYMQGAGGESRQSQGSQWSGAQAEGSEGWSGGAQGWSGGGNWQSWSEGSDWQSDESWSRWSAWFGE